MLRISWVLLLSLGLVSGWNISAEENAPSAEDEDKIAAKEDAEADDNMQLKQKNVFTGTVFLVDADKPVDRGVIGSFLCSDGITYPMKAASDEVLTKLKTVDQTKVTVAGKLRVNGKYLVVMALVASTPSPTPRDKRKRSGL